METIPTLEMVMEQAEQTSRIGRTNLSGHRAYVISGDFRNTLACQSMYLSLDSLSTNVTVALYHRHSYNILIYVFDALWQRPARAHFVQPMRVQIRGLFPRDPGARLRTISQVLNSKHKTNHIWLYAISYMSSDPFG